MNGTKAIDQQIIDFLKAKGTGTVDEICAGLKIGRTSARKYLAGLTVDKKVHRDPGGRDGRRRLPDIFSLPGRKRRGGKLAKATGSRRSSNGRLGPGELDKHVLAYLRRHKKAAPHTPSAVAKAIERSAGAVANCLGRLEKAKEVRLVKSKPREYELVETKRR